jgi:drug/metabolite transporter (DMT)-like permease
VLGVLVLNERLTLVMAGSFGLILLGSVLATRGGGRGQEQRKPGPEELAGAAGYGGATRTPRR